MQRRDMSRTQTYGRPATDYRESLLQHNQSLSEDYTNTFPRIEVCCLKMGLQHKATTTGV